MGHPCLYCRTENAFANYRRHPSASSLRAAAAKFGEIVNLPTLPPSRQVCIIAAIRACPARGSEAGQDVFARWLLGDYEAIRPAVEQTC